MNHKLRVAVLDLNNNVVNRGIPYIKKMLESFGEELSYQVFDVRHKLEIPDTHFDIYISSGGPGSPFDFEGGWDKNYFGLIEKLKQHNNDPSVENKKYVFFICHSYQLACQYFKVGQITKRRSMSFGTFPCFKTSEGENEAIFDNLPNPFYIADFRDWQVTNADINYLQEQNFEILALEKARPHVDLPRAIMAVRFSDEMIGTQFHPEADADGMLSYFQEPERRKHIIAEHGIARYEQMLSDLEDDMKIDLTHRTILPTFLNDAIGNLKKEMVEA
jgi:homoserine O-succinyltransferase/O-acetyltransferase